MLSRDESRQEETDLSEEESFYEGNSNDIKEKKKKNESQPLNIIFPYVNSIPENQDYFSSATQTPPEFQKPSKVFTVDHYLHDSVGGTLIEKYYETVLEYIENVNVNELSSLRREICERIQQRIKFQKFTFGNISKNFDEQPQNLYNSFNASLCLVLYEDHFVFSTAQKGFEISGSIDDEMGRTLLSYISRGLLKPGLFSPDMMETLKNLSWYDGCLICEITDCRGAVPRSVRTQLKISQYDIQTYDIKDGVENEQSFILAQNPLVCLDTSPAVANVARAAINDRLRWEPDNLLNESKLQFVARRRPDLFLQNNVEKKDDDFTFSRQTMKNYRQKMIESMLGNSFRDSNEDSK